MTDGNLDHQNCVSFGKPSTAQLVTSSIVHGALYAELNMSARILVDQLRHQTKMTASCHVMYHAKDTINEKLFSEDSTKITLLPSLLSEFQRLNPGTVTELQSDKKGRFHWVIVVLNSKWFSNHQGFFDVDSAHMKHRKYNGVQIVLASHDRNFKLLQLRSSLFKTTIITRGHAMEETGTYSYASG